MQTQQTHDKEDPPKMQDKVPSSSSERCPCSSPRLMDWRRRHRWHGCQRGRSTRPSAPQVWDSRCPLLRAWASGTEAAAAAAKSRGSWKVPSGWPPAKWRCCKNTAFWFGRVFRLFVFVFITSFIPCRDFGSLYLGNLTVAARTGTHLYQCVCAVFLCVPTMEWPADFGILLIHTSVCAVFLCVPTVEWLAVFGILLILTSVCSIFVCPNNGMASSVWDTTHSYQCLCSIFACPNNSLAASVWDF